MEHEDTPFALVVDDNAAIRKAVCEILKRVGFRPLEACDADEALQILNANADDIALLFTDVQMPGKMNGFDLARESARIWPDLKILVASGTDKPGPNALPPNAVFVEKPFSALVVEARLQELLPEGQKPEPLKRRATG